MPATADAAYGSTSPNGLAGDPGRLSEARAFAEEVLQVALEVPQEAGTGYWTCWRPEADFQKRSIDGAMIVTIWATRKKCRDEVDFNHASNPRDSVVSRRGCGRPPTRPSMDSVWLFPPLGSPPVSAVPIRCGDSCWRAYRRSSHGTIVLFLRTVRANRCCPGRLPNPLDASPVE